jgi:hypothetical protein
MSGIAAAVLGAVAGLSLAGVMAALLVEVVPPQLRGAKAVWGVAAATVAFGMWVATRLAKPRP